MRLKRGQLPRSATMRPALGFLRSGAVEARALGHNYIGTEHLLLALLTSHTGSATIALERLGIASDQIRDRLLSKLSKPPAPRVDADALATLGIDLERVRARLEDTFGPGAIEQTTSGCMPIAPRAKLALAYAVDEARGQTVGDNHVLIGLLRAKDSLAANVLAELGVSIARVRGMLGG
jgi:ATP-dependent Clp protease ATP-binding subunit ClpA